MAINTAYLGIAVTFLLCLIYEANAIKCYHCTTYEKTQKWCDDNHLETGGGGKVVDCDTFDVDNTRASKPDACFKIVQIHHRIVAGGWNKPKQVSNITTRGCGYLSGNAGCKSLLGAQTYGWSCACEGDKCNTAASLPMTLTLILSILATIFISKLIR